MNNERKQHDVNYQTIRKQRKVIYQTIKNNKMSFVTLDYQF